MMFFMILSLWALVPSPSREAWAQKSLPTVRIGIEAVAGTNSHYYVTKQLGLFQKHGLNLELISFPGGTVGIQSLLAGDLQFATADGNLGLTANLRGANLYFYRRHDQHLSLQYFIQTGSSYSSRSSRQEDSSSAGTGPLPDTAVRAAVEKI